MERGVCITGIGTVTRNGAGTKQLLRLLHEGDAIAEIAGAEFGRHGHARTLGRAGSAFFLAACEAWGNAGLPEFFADGTHAGLIEGSSLGAMPDALDALRSQDKARPTDVLRFMAGAGGAAFAQRKRITGSVKHVSAASVSSLLAVIEGVRMIRNRECDFVIAGGADYPNQADVIARFASAGLLADECKPYAADRCGTVLAPGAAAFVLEAEDSAHARDASIIARFGGVGIVTESHSRIAPAPNGNGVSRVVKQVLADTPGGRISWIKGHGTGTRAGDHAECAGLAAALGWRLTEVPITALKPTLGHTLGASGALELAATLVAQEFGFLPHTRGTRAVDESLPPIDLVTSPRPAPGGYGLFLSQSFGGRCAAVTVTVDRAS